MGGFNQRDTWSHVHDTSGSWKIKLRFPWHAGTITRPFSLKLWKLSVSGLGKRRIDMLRGWRVESWEIGGLLAHYIAEVCLGINPRDVLSNVVGRTLLLVSISWTSTGPPSVTLWIRVLKGSFGIILGKQKISSMEKLAMTPIMHQNWRALFMGLGLHSCIISYPRWWKVTQNLL